MVYLALSFVGFSVFIKREFFRVIFFVVYVGVLLSVAAAFLKLDFNLVI